MTDNLTHSTTVLVAEDQVNLADLFATWLEDEFAIRIAYDGDEAIEEVDDDVDVVLLDRRMPGRSGDDVLEYIRERDFDCRVVMVTAVTPDFDVLEMGFDSYLMKPVTKGDLVSVIERMLNRSRYDSLERELVSLSTKKALVEKEMSQAELATSAKYHDLKNRIEALLVEVDASAATFEDPDFEAAWSNL